VAGDPVSTLWEVPVIVAALLSWLTSPPVSIGEAAERELLRRQITAQSTAAYTNVDLPAGGFTDPAAPGDNAPAAAGAQVDRPGIAAAGPSAPTAGGEQWWRDRAAALRFDIERTEIVIEAMQARINALTSDVVSRDDPFQRGALREQLQRAIAEFDRLQGVLISQRRQLEELHTEARRQGVPPGWLR
jgi:hypothetical protein